MTKLISADDMGLGEILSLGKSAWFRKDALCKR